MNKPEITLRWCYTSGQDYEFHSSDSAQVGQLYRLKILESQVIKVEVIKDGITVIEWSKENE
jgi:hypothetical protein